MRKSVKSRAEALFTASQKKDREALREKEKAREELAERVGKLRALRLAKEAADKEAADKEAAELAAAKAARKRSRKPAAKAGKIS